MLVQRHLPAHAPPRDRNRFSNNDRRHQVRLAVTEAFMSIESASHDNDATSPKINLPDGPPMPEMREGQLGTAQVEQLFSDLASCTQVLAILEKGGQQDHAKSNNTDLSAARDRFLNREILAVQIRYHYDNAVWIDTLLHSPTGIRAVRCQQR